MHPREIMEQVIRDSMPYMHDASGLQPRSIGDLFIFIGLLVCIGAIGVWAAYRIFKEFF